MVSSQKSQVNTTTKHKSPSFEGLSLFDKIRPSQYDEENKDTDRNPVRIRNSFIPAVRATNKAVPLKNFGKGLLVGKDFGLSQNTFYLREIRPSGG